MFVVFFVVSRRIVSRLTTRFESADWLEKISANQRGG
jgi:hypothetical protein